MSLAPGARLGTYEIVAPLGAGGMGEVYRAHDEKLDRDVAVKVLPEGALADEAARSRFRREARALSRLSHPHIATIHDFDTDEGLDFLVMELVTGPSLEEALRPGPMPEKEVVRLGAELARGLQAAHDQGIVHRDLKPSNLALTPDGLLKILDFGLSRLVNPRPPSPGHTTATETAGVVAGSPPYMAPEQLLGKAVDARTDVYAAGACLYEMAIGRRPHGEKHGAALTEAILHEAIAPPRSHNGTLSAGLEAVILKCVDKDPGLRYQTARELLVDLERLHAVATSSAASQRPQATHGWRRHWPWFAVAAGVAVTATAGWLVRDSAPPRLIEIRAVTNGLDPSTESTLRGARSWATDGSRLYFVGPKNGQMALFQVPIAGGDPVEIPVPLSWRRAVYGYSARESALLMTGAEAAEASIAASPDGWPLWWVAVAGGAPRRPGGLRGIEAALSRDGERLAVVQSRRVLVARSDGTDPRTLMERSEAYDGYGFAWSPDGRRLRYTASAPESAGQSQDRVGSADVEWIWEVTVADGRPRALWPGSRGTWSADGDYYFFQLSTGGRRTDIWGVPERPWSRWLSARPQRLTHGPLDFGGAGTASAGRTLYAWGRSRRGELQRVDPSSGRLSPFLDGLSAADVAVSADRQWLAWVAYPAGTLWRSRADGTDRLQLTMPPLSANLPRFSPDGRQIVFVGSVPGEPGNSIRLISVAGGAVEVLAAPQRVSTWWDTCWLPDGVSLVSSSLATREPGLYRIDSRSRAVSPLPGAETLIWPVCRPQGGILARVPPSRSSGRFTSRVYWPDTARFGPALDFVGYPNWSRDGRAVIGYGDDGRIRRFSIDSGTTEILADLSGIRRAGLAAGPWMGLAPDDSPLILHSFDTMELYALDWEAP